jgi:hypothetical protein
MNKFKNRFISWFYDRLIPIEEQVRIAFEVILVVIEQ